MDACEGQRVTAELTSLLNLDSITNPGTALSLHSHYVDR